MDESGSGPRPDRFLQPFERLDAGAAAPMVSLDRRTMREIGQRLRTTLGPPSAELPLEFETLVAAIAARPSLA